MSAQRANIEIKSVMIKHSITGPSDGICFSSMIGMVGIFPMVPSEDISRSIMSVTTPTNGRPGQTSNCAIFNKKEKIAAIIGIVSPRTVTARFATPISILEIIAERMSTGFMKIVVGKPKHIVCKHVMRNQMIEMTMVKSNIFILSLATAKPDGRMIRNSVSGSSGTKGNPRDSARLRR